MCIRDSFCPSSIMINEQQLSNLNYNEHKDGHQKATDNALSLQNAEWIQLLIPKQNLTSLIKYDENHQGNGKYLLNDPNISDETILEVWCKVHNIKEWKVQGIASSPSSATSAQAAVALDTSICSQMKTTKKTVTNTKNIIRKKQKQSSRNSSSSNTRRFKRFEANTPCKKRKTF
eukprot:TRINITY_DN7108_c0_g2_i1.p1 TRINITY_DN7108_c0_g2~~TRINITY_DN7108_c0_g2_i1.p1  ORF type:complete len:202 (+),score=45.79 TRINITY_DN7108_c0_g2_i1:83-607(+)